MRYGILDDDDNVIRWVWDKPSPSYRYIERKLLKLKSKIDWNNYEPALI
jgi:hypothetical protein